MGRPTHGKLQASRIVVIGTVKGGILASDLR
jgi:hypothetical protein